MKLQSQERLKTTMNGNPRTGESVPAVGRPTSGGSDIRPGTLLFDIYDTSGQTTQPANHKYAESEATNKDNRQSGHNHKYATFRNKTGQKHTDRTAHTGTKTTEHGNHETNTNSSDQNTPTGTTPATLPTRTIAGIFRACGKRDEPSHPHNRPAHTGDSTSHWNASGRKPLRTNGEALSVSPRSTVGGLDSFGLPQPAPVPVFTTTTSCC